MTFDPTWPPDSGGTFALAPANFRAQFAALHAAYVNAVAVAALLDPPVAGEYIRWNLAGTALESGGTPAYSLGNFLQSGTGAVERTAISKLGTIIDAEDFGVSPGASAATNAAGLQAAHDAVPATGGGLRLPTGTIDYDTGLVVTRQTGFHMYGRGRWRGMRSLANAGATVLNYTGTGPAIVLDPTIVPAAIASLVLEKFSLLVPSGGIGIEGISTDSSGEITDIFFRDVQIVNAAGDLTGVGIRSRKTIYDQWWNFQGCHVQGFDVGVHLQSGAQHTFDGDTIVHNNTRGVVLGSTDLVNNPADVHFLRCDLRNDEVSVDILSGKHIVVDGAYTEQELDANTLTVRIGHADGSDILNVELLNSWYMTPSAGPTRSNYAIETIKVNGLNIAGNTFRNFATAAVLNTATSVARAHFAPTNILDGAFPALTATTGFWAGLRKMERTEDRVSVLGTDNVHKTQDTSSRHLFARSDGQGQFGIDPRNLSFPKLQFPLGVDIIVGAGSPAGVVGANIGSLYLRTDGGASTTLYVKESGTGTSGWAAK
jgi:hypothetical protein